MSIRIAYGAGNSLEEIGIAEDTAKAFTNKYNSMIIRAPGKGPLVTTAEARDWASDKMSAIVAAVFSRAQS